MNGYITSQYVMTPENYGLWSRRDDNIFVSADAADDIVDYYNFTEGNVLSKYTIERILSSDRDYAELHGIDMSTDSLLLSSLNKLGFISKLGTEGDDYTYSEFDYRIYDDKAITPDGESVVVLTIVES